MATLFDPSAGSSQPPQAAPPPAGAPLGVGKGAAITAAMMGGGGGAGSAIGPNAASFMLNNPNQLYRTLLDRQGKAYAPHGMFTAFRQSAVGQALSALLNLQTSGGGKNLDQLGSMIDQFGGMLGGGNYYTDTSKAAGNALQGIDLSSMDPDQVDKLIKMVIGLNTQGQSGFAQNAASNRYSDFLSNYQDQATHNDMADTQNLGDVVKQQPFWNSLAWLNQNGK